MRIFKKVAAVLLYLLAVIVASIVAVVYFHHDSLLIVEVLGIVALESFVVLRWVRPRHPSVYRFIGIVSLSAVVMTPLLLPRSLLHTVGSAAGVQYTTRLLTDAHRQHGQGETESATVTSVDDLISKLATAPMAVSTPSAMRRDTTATVSLVLDPSKTLDELMVNADKHTTKGYTVSFANRMQARLTGEGFTITAHNPDLQAVTSKAPTRWAWDVRALQEGPHELHVTLDALLLIDGESTPRTIQTFDRTVKVEVTVPQRLGDFFKTNWQWVWTVAVVPVTGWITRKKEPAAPRRRRLHHHAE